MRVLMHQEGPVTGHGPRIPCGGHGYSAVVHLVEFANLEKVPVPAEAHEDWWESGVCIKQVYVSGSLKSNRPSLNPKTNSSRRSQTPPISVAHNVHE